MQPCQQDWDVGRSAVRSHISWGKKCCRNTWWRIGKIAVVRWKLFILISTLQVWTEHYSFRHRQSTSGEKLLEQQWCRWSCIISILCLVWTLHDPMWYIFYLVKKVVYLELILFQMLVILLYVFIARPTIFLELFFLSNLCMASVFPYDTLSYVIH